MNTTDTADIKFLKRILFGLVAATLTAGALASIATVNAGVQGSHSFFDYSSISRR